MDRLTADKKSPIKGQNKFLKWGLYIIHELFPILLITYLLLILTETIFEGSVSFYVNLNHLLIAVIIVGIAALMTSPPKAEKLKVEHLSVGNVIIIICAGITGAAIIWYKTQEIGWLSYVISVLGGVLIVFLSMLVWGGDEEGERENNQGS